MTDWSSYAAVYDVMAENNPSYREIGDRFSRIVSAWPMPSGARLAEIGAGTGNFSLSLAACHRNCQVVHVEPDSGMNKRVAEKALERSLNNFEVIAEDAESVKFACESLSAVVFLHSLYTMPAPKSAIANAFDWLQPGGYVFACDFGRQMNVSDWARYLFFSMRREKGLKQTLMTFFRARQVAKQNRRIADLQRAGKYWLHDLAEFQTAFQSVGFDILTSFTCYRGYSDVVICRKP